VSISFLITFDAAPAKLRKLVYVLNSRLRRLGLAPPPSAPHPGAIV
jgi:hypothetical protein